MQQNDFVETQTGQSKKPIIAYQMCMERPRHYQQENSLGGFLNARVTVSKFFVDEVLGPEIAPYI